MADGISAALSREGRPRTSSTWPPGSRTTSRLVASTRSEVAVPILWGDEVVAVLNVEREPLGGFDHERDHHAGDAGRRDRHHAAQRRAVPGAGATNAKLVELDRMKSELVNIVAHDFRAPLAGVLGHAELLEWRPDAPARSGWSRRGHHPRRHPHGEPRREDPEDEPPGDGPASLRVRGHRLAAVAREVVGRGPAKRATHWWRSRWRRTAVPSGPIATAGRGARQPDLERGQIFARRGAGARPSPRGRAGGGDASRQGIGIGPGDFGRLFRPFSRVRDSAHRRHQGSGPRPVHLRPHRPRARRRLDVATPGEGSVFSFTVPLFGAAAQTRRRRS